MSDNHVNGLATAKKKTMDQDQLNVFVTTLQWYLERPEFVEALFDHSDLANLRESAQPLTELEFGSVPKVVWQHLGWHHMSSRHLIVRHISGQIEASLLDPRVEIIEEVLPSRTNLVRKEVLPGISGELLDSAWPDVKLISAPTGRDLMRVISLPHSVVSTTEITQDFLARLVDLNAIRDHRWSEGNFIVAFRTEPGRMKPNTETLPQAPTAPGEPAQTPNVEKPQDTDQ
jgi:hypothetical protein